MRLKNEHGELKEALELAIEALETVSDRNQGEHEKAFNQAIEDCERIEEDKVFLLSTKEYEMYMSEIPYVKTWWWLRSPGIYSNYAAAVDYDGSVSYDGYYVNDDTDCVRPALRYSTLKSEISKSKEKNCFVWNETKWKIIDKEKEIAIAYMPISFDRFDDNSNDYEGSHIRKWLLDWSKE